MKINHFGTLYIVATPIGNLKDMSLRAVETLQVVNYIAAEDTRHSLPLLQHFSIKTPLISLHEYNERERVSQIMDRLEQGHSIALISDAGTPLISDPGTILVREVRRLKIPIVPIPGATAAITALCASGLPTNRFVFEGFLSSKAKSRRERLTELLFERRTMIFYESPHRIVDFLTDLSEVMGGQRNMVIARELTKLHETIHSGTSGECLLWVASDKNQQRGEIVLIVEGAKEAISNEKTNRGTEVLKIVLEVLPLKQAVEIAAKITGERKNALYQQALLLSKKR